MNKEKIKILANSLSPLKYKELAVLSIKKAYSHLIFVNILAVALLFIISVAFFPFISSAIDSKIADFNAFEFNVKIDTGGRIEFHKYPEIAFDSGQQDTDGEAVLVTNETIFLRPFPWKTHTVRWDNIDDFKSNTPTLKKAVITLYLLVLPGVMLLFLIINLLLTYLVVNVVSYLLWFAAKAAKLDIRFPQALKISLYATTIMMIVYVATFFFFYTWWIPLVVYLLFAGTVMFFMGGKTPKFEKKKSGKFKSNIDHLEKY